MSVDPGEWQIGQRQRPEFFSDYRAQRRWPSGRHAAPESWSWFRAVGALIYPGRKASD